ncbi:MAG TPA: hypothetical protein ENH82_13465 [bacterium]|nr:hypothetical protein [bacterium]
MGLISQYQGGILLVIIMALIYIVVVMKYLVKSVDGMRDGIVWKDEYDADKKTTKADQHTFDVSLIQYDRRIKRVENKVLGGG